MGESDLHGADLDGNRGSRWGRAVGLARRGRVVVAEDDAELRGAIAAALRRSGYEALEVGSGLELLERLRADTIGIDAVIADQRMPGRSGLEVLTELRREGRDVRFVLMIGSADEETCAEAFRLGVDTMFAKPFDLDDLLTAVLNLASRGAYRGET